MLKMTSCIFNDLQRKGKKICFIFRRFKNGNGKIALSLFYQNISFVIYISFTGSLGMLA